MIGIEPTTCWLQVSCSTVEPHQHILLSYTINSYVLLLSFKMAIRKGLEPSTSSVTGWHSNQLNYQAANGGTNRARTCDPLLVRQVLSQLSYSPGNWWPIGESNPCYRRERAVSWPLDQWAIFIWLRRQDSNLRPSGYEPDELPTAPPRDINMVPKTGIEPVREVSPAGF